MELKRELSAEEKRRLAQERAEELRERIQDYLEASKHIPTGFKLADQYEERKQKILKILNATEEDWYNWKWQLRNRFTSTEQLAKVLDLTDQEIEDIERVGKKYRWAASPYYVSLMDPKDPNCPIRKQAIPCIEELNDTVGEADPMGEEFTSPAPGITRRYPDRLIINVTNLCAMYCRHCQRRRNIGEVDKVTPKADLEAALDYVRQNPEIRDVLLTGGDAFMLSNDQLDWLLGELDKIEHVEIKRLGTRTLVTMPMRVTPELCAVLEKHHPVYVNTHFNHPKEITPEVAKACDRLTKAGVPIGNQAVLLRGINNDPHVMKKLNHELLKVRIRPYYIFHAKPVKGTTHFITRVEEGIQIMEHLRGYTSGLAIPTYLINAPHGYGKTPMLPEYLVSSGPDYVTIRTWEGRVMKYPNGVPNSVKE
ncbi:glutamate 2,3-aminomutase [Calderihabitans maritimus]|uniref:Lysine 2,3-aminomutase YodO family protein n=1 Tax=Calderihabitans maritimus TaxID=1246530 RepID=A0A1Z5HQ61_9FIRM|nr:glutamate 2,3-aminomutase [Calderihabitans maritimus]GAW91507.1 lysine 2,3-aminomutase YodO family protein [Calderihabitans maritimus]